MAAESDHDDQVARRAARLRRWAERQSRPRPRPCPAWRTMASAWATAVFAALRQALTLLPARAAGPDLPTESSVAGGGEGRR